MFKGDFILAAPALMPSGEEVIRYIARFKLWQGPEVEDTWNGKATLDFEGVPQWGEFAVLLSLTDGWDGYAVEVYNGLHFWRTSYFHPPDRRTTLEPPEHLRGFLDGVALVNGSNLKPRYAGCWDLLAWKGEEYRFIEVKRYRRDNFRDTQYHWFESARFAGIPASSFVIVEWVIESEPHPILDSGGKPLTKEISSTKLESIPHKANLSNRNIAVASKPSGSKWDENSFFNDLDVRTDHKTVLFTRELFQWSKRYAVKIEYGKGEKFGTIIPRMKHFDGIFSFFNIESRGFLWIYLKPFHLMQDEKRRLEMQSWLIDLPLMRRVPSDAVTHDWITIDLKALDTNEKQNRLIGMMEWLLERFKSYQT